MIEIHLNGEFREIQEDLTVQALLEQLDLVRKRVAVERNGTIVPKSRHAEATIDAGDRIEIVHAIGGG